MGTWTGMVEEVRTLLGGGHSASAETDRIKRAIVTAIERHRGEAFWFNESTATFATVASQSTYDESDGVPAGLISIQNRNAWIDPLQDRDSRRCLDIVIPQQIDHYRLGSDLETEPIVLCVHGGKVELWPTPDAIHDIGFRAVSDVGTIIKRYVSSAWKYYLPGTTSYDVGNELPADYPDPTVPNDPNPWFDEAYEMIKHYAAYILQSTEYNAMKGQAERLLQVYLECKDALMSRTASLQAPRFPDPYCL